MCVSEMLRAHHHLIIHSVSIRDLYSLSLTQCIKLNEIQFRLILEIFLHMTLS